MKTNENSTCQLRLNLFNSIASKINSNVIYFKAENSTINTLSLLRTGEVDILESKIGSLNVIINDDKPSRIYKSSIVEMNFVAKENSYLEIRNTIINKIKQLHIKNKKTNDIIDTKTLEIEKSGIILYTGSLHVGNSIICSSQDGSIIIMKGVFYFDSGYESSNDLMDGIQPKSVQIKPEGKLTLAYYSGEGFSYNITLDSNSLSESDEFYSFSEINFVSPQFLVRNQIKIISPLVVFIVVLLILLISTAFLLRRKATNNVLMEDSLKKKNLNEEVKSNQKNKSPDSNSKNKTNFKFPPKAIIQGEYISDKSRLASMQTGHKGTAVPLKNSIPLLESTENDMYVENEVDNYRLEKDTAFSPPPTSMHLEGGFAAANNHGDFENDEYDEVTNPNQENLISSIPNKENSTLTNPTPKNLPTSTPPLHENLTLPKENIMPSLASSSFKQKQVLFAGESKAKPLLPPRSSSHVSTQIPSKKFFLHKNANELAKNFQEPTSRQESYSNVSNTPQKNLFNTKNKSLSFEEGEDIYDDIEIN